MTKPQKYGTNPIELWDINKVKGADYNPRQAHEDRLSDLETSLLTLGFLLPLYALKDGTLLSGHQRTRTAKKMGYTKLPIVVLDVPPEMERGLNLLFNTATNDMGRKKPEQVYQELKDSSKDLSFSGDCVPLDTFPCLKYEKRPIMDYADYCLQFSTDKSITGAGNQLVTAGHTFMPLVVCGGRVINGVSRWFAAYSGGYTHIDVVEVSERDADFAYTYLNLLSMDFDMEATLKEELRANAFRNPMINNYILGLSRGWTYPVYKRTVRNSMSKDGEVHPDLNLLPHKSAKVEKQYRDVYGDYIVDFGAGTLDDANTVNKSGLTVFPFEPYHCAGKTNDTGTVGGVVPDADLSRLRCAEWLTTIEEHFDKGLPIDSIVSSYMMNSVPNHLDRMACIAIMAALCNIKTNVFICGTGLGVFKSRTKKFIDPSMETNMTMGRSVKTFKVQKYFHPEEMKKMLQVFFLTVETLEVGGVCYSHSKHPKRPNAQVLKEALEVEFNLPYHDGSRMNLVDEAKRVFGKITGLDLN